MIGRLLGWEPVVVAEIKSEPRAISSSLPLRRLQAEFGSERFFLSRWYGNWLYKLVWVDDSGCLRGPGLTLVFVVIILSSSRWWAH